MPAVALTSRSVRNAMTGTARTSWREAIETSTSAFMPGISSPSGLLIEMITANMVTFCSTTACGSIFTTSPAKGWFG